MFGLPESHKNAVHGDLAILLDYSARKLNVAETARVDEHLKACAECRQVADGQRAVWEALDMWEAAPVSPDFDRRLYQRIDNEVSWLDRAMRPFRPLFVRHGVAIAAMACLLLVAGVLLQRPADVAAPGGGGKPEISTEQAENALQEMEMLREFSRIAPADNPQPAM